MARKRRSKPRKPAQNQSLTSTMSSEDSYALDSVRQSTDEAMSDHAPSDGVHTAITSVADSEEDHQHQHQHQHQHHYPHHPPPMMYEDEEEDMISIYPRSHYPTYRQEDSLSHSYSPSFELDMAASTRSLWAQDLDYREIHGRRYCREYYMPNDELEQMRLTLQHQVFVHVLNGDLTLAPVQNPTHILDVGTGTGEWAIRMAELFPTCEVVGTDIAAIAETRGVPVNVFFEIEDAEEWDRNPDLYDLVHLRCMDGAFKDWNFIYDNAYYSLKPGGWIEIQDFDSAEGFLKFVESFPPGSPMKELNADLCIAAEMSGRPRGVFHMDPNLLIQAGFVDVRVMEYVIPITVSEPSAGKIWLLSCLDALEAYCLRLLTEYMGWDPEKCKAACERTARDMAEVAKNPEQSKGLSVKLRTVIGRKPVDAQPVDPESPLQRGSSPNTEVVGDEGSPDPTLHPGDDETREPSPTTREDELVGTPS